MIAHSSEHEGLLVEARLIMEALVEDLEYFSHREGGATRFLSLRRAYAWLRKYDGPVK